MNAIATVLIRHRLFALLIACAITIFAGIGSTRLTFNDQVQQLFESNEDVYDTLHELFDSFGTDDRECLILIEVREGSGTVFDTAVVTFLKELEVSLEAIEGISRATSYLDLIHVESDDAAALRSAALANALVRGRLVTPGGRKMLVVAQLGADIEGTGAIAPVVAQMREVIDAERRAAPPELAIDVRITGIPPLRVDIIETLRRDQTRFLVIGATLGIVIAWVIFRHLVAVLITTVTPIIGAVWSLGLMGWTGAEVNVINAVMPTLVMVIGFTDAVHLMVDIRHSRASGMDGRAAGRHAIRYIGPACAMTSFTTFVGFGSLYLASVTTIQQFGLACAAGVVLTFLAVIVIIPLAASYARTDRLVDPERFRRLENRRQRCVRLIAPVLNHPRRVAVAGIILTLALGAIAFQLRADNRIAESIPNDIEAAQALDVVDENFGGILQVSIMISPDSEESTSLNDPVLMALLRELHDVLDEAPYTNGALSLRTILLLFPGEQTDDALAARTGLLDLAPQDILARLYDPQSGRLAVHARVPDAGGIYLEKAFTQIESDLVRLREEYPAYDLDLTGTTILAVRNIRLMIGDLAKSLGLAAIVILVAVSIAFRSVRLGAISIIPNVFPLVATAALLVIVGLPLQITSVIVFTVCLGIAVDDTIHFVSRYAREMRENPGKVDGVSPVRRAVERSFVRVGSALLITTVVLICGFGAVTLSEVPAIRLYAQLSCFAILMALLGDLIILPALLLCFARKSR